MFIPTPLETHLIVDHGVGADLMENVYNIFPHRRVIVALQSHSLMHASGHCGHIHSADDPLYGRED